MVGKRCLHSQVPAAWHPYGDGGCGSERTARAGTGCSDSACGMLKLPRESLSAKILSCCTDSKPSARGRACLAHPGTGWSLLGCTGWFAHRAVHLAPSHGDEHGGVSSIAQHRCRGPPGGILHPGGSLAPRIQPSCGGSWAGAMCHSPAAVSGSLAGTRGVLGGRGTESCWEGYY